MPHENMRGPRLVYNLGPRCIIGEPTATLLRAFGGIGASDGYVVP